ncbi:hypothetical protein GCM10010123_16720 [Pilimelia anulata]|uniref:Uncharacterized protein n=1 Tax=Pilimelia anulata TaxID=53371 RepID=A0A8J3FBW4_9ACTN|nr:hypothetical protein [Pilimelia anulata]GGJ87787.1 hypothetical protein GCM10010123_16720 [Pilimelia anulata]
MSEPPRPPYGNDPDEPTRHLYPAEEPTAPMYPASDPTPPPPARPPGADLPPGTPPPPGPPPGGFPPPPGPPPPGAVPPPAAFPPPGAVPPGFPPAAAPPPAPPVPPPGGAFPPGDAFPPPGGPPPAIGEPYPGPGLPVPPPKRKTGKVVAVIIAVIVLLLCLCGAAAIWIAKLGFDEAKKKDDALPTGVATPTTSGADNQLFEKGDCVVNDGNEGDAKLRKVPCAAGAYEVVARLLFTTDRTKCDNPFLGAGRGQYDSTYTHPGSDPPTDSYVLCMKKR